VVDYLMEYPGVFGGLDVAQVKSEPI